MTIQEILLVSRFDSSPRREIGVRFKSFESSKRTFLCFKTSRPISHTEARADVMKESTKERARPGIEARLKCLLQNLCKSTFNNRQGHNLDVMQSQNLIIVHKDSSRLLTFSDLRRRNLRVTEVACNILRNRGDAADTNSIADNRCRNLSDLLLATGHTKPRPSHSYMQQNQTWYHLTNLGSLYWGHVDMLHKSQATMPRPSLKWLYHWAALRVVAIPMFQKWIDGDIKKQSWQTQLRLYRNYNSNTTILNQKAQHKSLHTWGIFLTSVRT